MIKKLIRVLLNCFRAFARIGKSYMKKDDNETALKYLHKSLSEHRTPDTAKLVTEV